MRAYLPLAAVLACLLAWPPTVRGRPLRRPTGRRWSLRSVRGPDELAWLDAVVAELVGGRHPAGALAAVPESALVCPAATAAARAGGDVATAMRTSARSPLVRGVAACWEVAQGSGAGLAASLETLVGAARETERIRGELAAGLAEPRATAVVLAALPAFGLLLGTMLGAEPLGWLVGSPLGVVALAAGVGLETIGAWWSWRITNALERAL